MKKALLIFALATLGARTSPSADVVLGDLSALRWEWTGGEYVAVWQKEDPPSPTYWYRSDSTSTVAFSFPEGSGASAGCDLRMVFRAVNAGASLAFTFRAGASTITASTGGIFYQGGAARAVGSGRQAAGFPLAAGDNVIESADGKIFINGSEYETTSGNTTALPMYLNIAAVSSVGTADRLRFSEFKLSKGGVTYIDLVPDESGILRNRGTLGGTIGEAEGLRFEVMGGL